MPDAPRPAEALPDPIDLARAVRRAGRVVLPDGRVAVRGRKTGTVAIGPPPRPFPTPKERS